MTVLDLVSRRDSGVAITGDGRTLTYGELWRRSDLVASALSSVRGRVGYVDRNGTEFWELFLGALKAGVTLVPLNFRLSAEELAWICADAGISLVVAGDPFVGALPPSVRVVPIGRDYEDWLSSSPAAVSRDPGPVLLMYSSGTTGRPKGVRIEDGQLAWTVGAFGSQFSVDSATVSLVPTPYHHIAGAGWSLITLAAGGTIVQNREPTPSSMLAQLLSFRATHAAMVPALIDAIVSAPSASDVTALRHVVYGGAPISPALMKRATDVLGARFHQSYGLTETTGVATILSPEDHFVESRLLSVGRPLPGLSVSIDSASGSGEILVRGPSLTSGYWARGSDDLFTPDGWLRTGDAGVIDDDGYLYLRDRIKDMIISGGENVYPAEVEKALFDHPAVLDVAVIGIPSDRWGETPLAVVVARSSVDGAELIAWCRERMAHFKCPTGVVFVDALPRNASGKVLKRVLREPHWKGNRDD
ncbi:AMP-binding protein [Virgisporangium aurantiacum]|uniref:Acyl-CoA synthetase n=1 Tax=Virgisporangium aurantiacum TaxID=175570 RepID=A0A8J3Z631_9ACTN|nr:AMP-binding protein [Virgisporangium aurantiacum]GIJ55673.1 acyl-CoA synthetase [Virgisporangium aurantiacum]